MTVLVRGLLVVVGLTGFLGCASEDRKGCRAGDYQACYTGSEGTEDLGICHGGIAYCDAQGLWGPCLDEQVPTDENCFNALDDDCDGQVNEEGDGCACEPDSLSACYAGDPATEGVGNCVAGSMTCNAWGIGWGPCQGAVLPQPEDFHQLGDENCDGVPGAEFEWTLVAGGTEFEGVQALAVDGGGNLIVVVALMGEFTLGGDTFSSPTGIDVVLIKLDPDGNYLWGRQIGDGPAGSDNQEIYTVVANGTDEIYLAGRFKGTFGPWVDLLESLNHYDVWVVKLDGEGQHLWRRQLSHTSGATPSYGDKQANDLAIAGDQLVLVGDYAGNFGSPGGCLAGMCSLPDATGYSDPFVVLLDRETGGVDEVVHFTSTGAAVAKKVVVDSSGDIVVAGSFALDHDVLPGQAGGDWASVGLTDIFVVKLDPALVPVWHNTIGTERSDSLGALVLDPDNHPVIVGSIDDDLGGDALLVYKMQKDSQNLGGFGIKEYPIASRLFAATPDAPCIATGAVMDEFGNLIIGGAFQGSASFGHETLVSVGILDGFVLKLDPGFDTIWARQIGSQSMDMLSGISMGHDDTIVLGGLVGGSIDFGEGAASFGGQVDLFVAKLHL